VASAGTHVRRPRRGGRWFLSLAAASAAVAAYALVARPSYLRWGATEEEVTRRLPGDDLAADSTVGSTRAITIEAPVEEVWPWLVQIGYGRGDSTATTGSGMGRLRAGTARRGHDPADRAKPGPGAWGRLSHYLFWEPAHFVMERRMLVGIKERAERLARDRRPPVSLT
jgi:hypothetical protein